ncbi:MAG: glycine cleavage system protein H [Desulfohalobiaceae bacterium]
MRMDSNQVPEQQEKPCVWTQAGVVGHKHCLHDYDCGNCAYNQALRRVCQKNKELRQADRTPPGKAGQLEFWEDRFKRLPVLHRPCIHHLQQRISFRPCTNEYNCQDCEFDQEFSELYSVHTVLNPISFLEAMGFSIPQGYYLHPGHCWVKFEEGSLVRVGLDDFCTRVLGPFDQIELPLLGKRVFQGQPAFKILRESHASHVLAPLSGVVTDINPQVQKKGSRTIQARPYSDFWLFRIKWEGHREELSNLLLDQESKYFLQQEARTLFREIELHAGPLAADGGQIAPDLLGQMPELGWERLSSLFLRSGD